MAAVLIGLVVLGWLGYRQVIQPISTAAGSLKRLSEGEKTEALAASPLREIEVLRRAITSFSQALDQMARMTEEKTAAEETKRAEWRAHMDRLADDFEASVGGVVESVSSSSIEMRSSAQAMAASADETNRQSTFVAAASEQATSNVQTVSAAAEER